MALDLNTITPASLKAKEVATQEYVDTQVAAIPDPTWENLQNKDTFARQLGFADYATLESVAGNGTTVINGGFINTVLLQADAASVKNLLSQEIVIDDSAVSAAKIKNSSGTMEIDFKNGSIYIA